MLKLPWHSPLAYLLVFHGSRDPRPQQAAQELAHLFARGLPPHTLVDVASLELAPRPLSEHIVQLAAQVEPLGVKTLKIIPLFLLWGVHVSQDIPQQLEQARKVLPPSFHLELRPHLGSYASLASLLAEQLQPLDRDGGVLLAHGSRRPQSLEAVENLASQLGLIAAYWSVSPSLSAQVEKLTIMGKKSLLILPYFLFGGGITDAIAQTLPALQSQFSQVQLSLGQPLGATPKLAEIILRENHAIG